MSLKTNLLARFSVISFIIMAILAVVIAQVLTSRLDHNIELLQAHGKAMEAMMHAASPASAAMAHSPMKHSTMKPVSMKPAPKMPGAMAHAKPTDAVKSHAIDDTEAFSIPNLMKNVQQLQLLTYGIVGVGFVVLYGSLVSTVWGGWRTIRRQQTALTETNGALMEARDVAEAANQSKSEFLAGVSHELLNPLNEIVAESERAQEAAHDLGQESWLRPLGAINQAGNHLLIFFNDLVELAKIDAGKTALQLQVFSIKSMVQGVQTSVKSLLESNHHTLKVRLSTDIGVIQGDQKKVQHVLVTLLSHISKNGTLGTMTLEAIREVKESATWVAFRVSSTGYSLTSARQQKVFQDLGLAMSQQLCQMMGGEITVASNFTKGTTFTVMLPAEPGDAMASNS